VIVLEKIADVRRALREARGDVGFVPTMGALHAGHMSLVARARDENELAVVSIFVNPTQFGPNEDLSNYPRPIAADLDACEKASVDVVFKPSGAEVYPREPLTSVRVRGLTERMEGAHRPGHFDGVTLVVCKLLSIVGPCRAYFGQKDAQQLRVVRQMVDDLDLPAQIVACPTVRDADGLALSSRNVYLSADERSCALALPHALTLIRDVASHGEREVAALLSRGLQVLRGAGSVDYLECVDPDTLEPLEKIEGPALVAGAIRVGRTRLIDNIALEGSV
jgi:pantoate--beta-alanine ligase